MASTKAGMREMGHADVVLDVQPLVGLRQRDAFADVPEVFGLGHAFGHHGVAHAARFQRGFQQGFKARAGVGLALVVGVFQQHVLGATLPQGHAYSDRKSVV